MINITYNNLLKDILKNGIKKEDRTGTGTISVFGRMISHDMRNEFPLLTSKRVWFKGVAHELIWFLSGSSNIKYLVENGVHIWDDWVFKKYAIHKNLNLEPNTPKYEQEIKTFVDKIIESDEFAKQWGDLGPVYGTQWIKWKYHNFVVDYSYKKEIDNHSNVIVTGSAFEETVNQIQESINLLKNNPDSRRILVSAWNAPEAPNMALPPCHYAFQLYSKEMTHLERWNEYCNKTNDYSEDRKSNEYLDSIKFPKRYLTLMWHQRSVDTFLGLPFNIASYALLLKMFAEQTNMIPFELKATLGDTHIYLNHIEQVNKQLSRDTSLFELPSIKLDKVDSIFDYQYDNIHLLNYNSHSSIKAPIAV